jgi:hypothetical protein
MMTIVVDPSAVLRAAMRCPLGESIGRYMAGKAANLAVGICGIAGSAAGAEVATSATKQINSEWRI